MIGSGAPIPIWILIRHNSDVILHHLLQMTTVVGDAWSVNVVDNIGEANGEEEHVSLVWMSSCEPIVRVLEFVYHVTFDGVYVFHCPHVK
ncbi:hypothetical protein OROGR_014568 [Orobanche gracilis]